MNPKGCFFVFQRVRVAVTGGIAEGKSTVLQMIESLGFSVDSADRIASEVFRRHEAEIANHLNMEMPLNRPALRAKLVNSEARKALNSITHPHIFRLLSQSPATFLEVPLLVETALQSAFTHAFVVTCGADMQLRRLTDRLGSERDALELIATQLPTKAKIPFADLIVRTNMDLTDVKRFVSAALAEEKR